MPSASKLSIRFFGDREVRAVWDESRSRWLFSALDIVGAVNGQDDHAKTRNYWKWLKAKLRREKPELVGAAIRLKLRAADGKRRLPALTDRIDDRETFMKGIDYSYYYEQADDVFPPSAE